MPTGATPDPDNPGWYSWGDFPRGSFAAATGRLLFKPDGPGRGDCRMFPTEAHMNMGGSIHGGAVMSFIDMAMFAGGRCAGMERGPLRDARPAPRISSRAARPACRSTRMSSWSGRPAATSSCRASCEQDGEPCYSFTGTLKRVTRAATRRA